MIFVTVGTHEQGFERLVKQMDMLVENGTVKEEVFIQLGYTEYEPKHCKFERLIGSDLMDEYTEKSRIVITHGGPGSIMLPFSYGKVPIVVPRQHEFQEHVDNHQVKFTGKLEEQKKVIAVYDIADLKTKIENYEELCGELSCDFNVNTDNFVAKFEEICNQLVEKKRKK